MSEPLKIAAIIVAAGRGARAGVADGPKQYRMLGSKPVLAHTLHAFVHHRAVTSVLTVIHEDDGASYAKAAPENPKILPPVHGGATRQASVFAGLQALAQDAPDLVLIHDAARPFLSAAVIDAVIAGLGEAKAALPATAIVDTIKRSAEDGSVADTISRDGLFAAQTPQGFDFATILEAHSKAAAAGLNDFTDDSALAEWAGHRVVLVAGSRDNLKLTTQDDIEKAQSSMGEQITDVRVGHGYDTHQLVAGEKITLCGVEIPFERKLSGHSDADVGLHALTDALLGTIADGDIGSHFPPSDPEWKGAQSDQFLAHAASLVRAAGGTITHCDVTLVCEAPKIGPHRDAMRAAMAAILDMDVTRISVKATTNERIGFIGREEGMVALATATVVMNGTTL
ncbi:bifunctional 2-C-methyl-D-erythritol 4-phosphate cytidylyltransferase/2-C-methyl-D-erythritol 2,4-cyclodiphosphate synthase [Pseudahrensia aquimaris]|uniref:Bifunctional enzyme IspD/IspF n=1 Tax=Pseudahrensia aquimaris TaxID=744461 RepID=A0ABW3FF99_9HYPH